jgi:hypothetical protein
LEKAEEKKGRTREQDERADRGDISTIDDVESRTGPEK